MTRCYLHDQEGDCWQQIDRAHFIPKQIIKRRFPYGAMKDQDTGQIISQSRIEDFVAGGGVWKPCPLDEVIWDPRVWRPICRYHHGQFDSGALMLPLALVPGSVFEFAKEYQLGWYTERAYPTPEVVSAWFG